MFMWASIYIYVCLYIYLYMCIALLWFDTSEQRVVEICELTLVLQFHGQ